ncbi:ComEA family DNA-binding protein [Pseudoalteromonas carrageenovora]
MVKKNAQAIVDYRQENGDFDNLDDLSNVKGIGKKL